MKKQPVVFLLIGLVLLFAGLGGCIVEHSPDNSQIMTMGLGDIQEFIVERSPSNKDVRIQWYISTGFKPSLTYNGLALKSSTQDEHSTFEFRADPAGENVSNKVDVVCRLHVYYETDNPYGIGYYRIDERRWPIEIVQAPPVWYGNYFVDNERDMLFLKENGYEDITNNLVIQGDTLTHVDALDGIRNVGGYVYITETPLLRNINGLSGLETVGECLYVYRNQRLEHLQGLKNLRSIGSTIHVEENDRLKHLEGLGGVSSIDTLNIWRNKSLVNLKGLGNLTEIHHLSISSNRQLASLDGLNNVSAIESLLLNQNDSLDSLDGLNQVTSMDRLFIMENEALSGLAGLANLVFIDFKLQISENKNLASLGLDSLSSVGRNSEGLVGSRFTITDNGGLCTYLAEDLRDQVVIFGGSEDEVVWIEHNKACERP